jgi:ribosomal protein S2
LRAFKKIRAFRKIGGIKTIEAVPKVIGILNPPMERKANPIAIEDGVSVQKAV